MEKLKGINLIRSGNAGLSSMAETLGIFFFACVLLGSCHSSSKEQGENEVKDIPVINLSEKVVKKDQFSLSDAAAKVDIVPLELTDQSVLGEINKVSVTVQDIWLTHDRDKRIYRFSREGKYLNKVGKIGEGPEKYSQLVDFLVDESQQEIYILSTANGVKVYDYEGNFKKRMTNWIIDNLFNANEGTILLYGQSLFLSQHLPVVRPINNPQDSLWSLALVDSSFQLRKLFKNPAHEGREEQIVENRSKPETFEVINYWTESSTSIDYYGGDFKVKYADTDTIYQYDVTTETFVPCYIPSSTEKRGDYGHTHLWIKERSAFDQFAITDFYDTRENVYLMARKGETIYTFKYNKAENNVEVIERRGKITERKLPWFSEPYRRLDCPFILTNDMCGGRFNVDYRSHGKYWIDVLEKGTDDNWIDMQEVQATPVKDESIRQEFLKVLSQTGEESNPVLVITMLK